jgi:hypothetical protein
VVEAGPRLVEGVFVIALASTSVTVAEKWLNP